MRKFALIMLSTFAIAPALFAEKTTRDLVFVRLNQFGAEQWYRIRDGATVIRIPRGEYARRRYEGKIATQKPKPFFVESFFVDRTEVSNAQFARFLNANAEGAKYLRFSVPGLERLPDGTSNRWRATPGLEAHPVTACTGDGAVAYAKWVGGRMPKVPEWEKAAGGVKGNLWPWGASKPDATRANFGGPRDGAGGLMPVGSFPKGASPYGCLDMAGNATERTIAPNRRGPVVIKGGSWVTPHTLNLRVLDMCVQPMNVAEHSVGFRVVMDDPEPKRESRAKKAPATLRFAKSWDAAIAEAKKRDVPIFLSLQYDTCGQCDRTRAQMFTDARFIAYCNERMVVVVGHRAGQAVDEPHTELDEGKCSLYTGLLCVDHNAVFNKAILVVERFVVSPGNFVLAPDGRTILVKERELPKWGWAVQEYLAKFEEARAKVSGKE